MKEYKGMSGKELRDWRKANRKKDSEQVILESTILGMATLAQEDKQMLIQAVRECYEKRKDRV